MTDTAPIGSPGDTTSWLPYRAWREGQHASVVGDLRVLPDVRAPQLDGRERDVLVLLPDGATESGRRYPVLYMHDGQNLFDSETSFAGEWQVDESMAALRDKGIEAIVVGVPNIGEHRFEEYTPFPLKGSPPWWARRAFGPGRPAAGEGPAYVRFVIETVKPVVDAAFPTRRDPAATGVMGSSLGGLISLWALWEHRDVFGFAGAMSPAFPPGQAVLLDMLRAQPPDGRRVYVDTGGHEGSMHAGDRVAGRWSKAFRRDVRRIRDSLLEAGFREGVDLMYVEEPDAIHHESAWARRLPDALRFLLGPLA